MLCCKSNLYLTGNKLPKWAVILFQFAIYVHMFICICVQVYVSVLCSSGIRTEGVSLCESKHTYAQSWLWSLFFLVTALIIFSSFYWFHLCESVYSLTTERFIYCFRNRLSFVGRRHIAQIGIVAYLYVMAYTCPRIYCRSVVYITFSISRYRFKIYVFVCLLYSICKFTWVDVGK